MKNYLFSLAILVCISGFGQKVKNRETFKITFQKSSNGSLIENQDPVITFATLDGSLITSEKILAGKAVVPYEKTFVDTRQGRFSQTAFLADGKAVSMIDSTALNGQKWELTPETNKILGYNCKKAKTVISSNWVEIWYTNELGVYGGPSVLGQKLGVVLEIVRNGSYRITAVKVEKNAKMPRADPQFEVVDAMTYKDELWKSRFVKIPLFQNQQVNFSDDTISDANTVRLQHGQLVLRRIKMPVIPPGSITFLDVVEKSRGDAYDRTGLVFAVAADNAADLIESLKKGDRTAALPSAQKIGYVKSDTQPPHLELMRFFTPFGISQYNDLVKLKNKTWHDSVTYRQDITDVASLLSGKEIVIGVHIGNYDKGGHEISANITIHKETIKNEASGVVLPLFNSSRFLENRSIDYTPLLTSVKGFETTITLSEPVRNARLRYIATGHGGWENGDEFLRRKNTIMLDGKEAYSFVPWRTDCGSYRLSNPASGNFENGLSSSDYSRSNWCPGTTTNPVWIDLGDLKAGEHTISVKIPVGEREGESTSSWTLSGVLLGE